LDKSASFVGTAAPRRSTSSLGAIINTAWPFDQSPDCAVITLRSIAFDGAPILRIAHDADDCGWQFLGSGVADKNQAAVLALSEIVRLDPTVIEVADLPPGWQAWRESKSSPWRRQEQLVNGA
jgi:hypothetical protein